jgi:hypothetical protein
MTAVASEVKIPTKATLAASYSTAEELVVTSTSSVESGHSCPKLPAQVVLQSELEPKFERFGLGKLQLIPFVFLSP